ncbi:MAG: helix-turn-helix domain-containing protein [Thermodesulfobacteriota bacterium]
MEEGLLSVIEAARFLGISPYTLRSWISMRKVDFVKLGRRTLFRPSDLKKLIQKGLVEARTQHGAKV